MLNAVETQSKNSCRHRFSPLSSSGTAPTPLCRHVSEAGRPRAMQSHFPKQCLMGSCMDSLGSTKHGAESFARHLRMLKAVLRPREFLLHQGYIVLLRFHLIYSVLALVTESRLDRKSLRSPKLNSMPPLRPTDLMHFDPDPEGI